MKTKICTECKVEKLLIEFIRVCTQTSGWRYFSLCIKCQENGLCGFCGGSCDPKYQYCSSCNHGLELPNAK